MPTASPEEIRSLIDQGADPNAKDHDGSDFIPFYDRTSLHFAVLNGNIGNVSLLLGLSANLNATESSLVGPRYMLLYDITVLVTI